MYCIAAESEAEAATTIVYSIAPCSSSLRSTFLIVEAFLADRDVHADQVLAFLVDDRIDGDGGLAGLPVADDELALAAADRHHRVDRLEAGLHRLRHRFARDHARRDFFDDVGHLGVDRSLAVDRLAERVDHAADQLGPDRHFENAARSF